MAEILKLNLRIKKNLLWESQNIFQISYEKPKREKMDRQEKNKYNNPATLLDNWFEERQPLRSEN